LATNAGNVLRCVFFGLVKTAWDDLGLEWNSPALADQGVALEGGPLGAIAATGEDFDRVSAEPQRVEDVFFGLGRVDVEAHHQRGLAENGWLLAGAARAAIRGHDRVGASADDRGHGLQIEPGLWP